MRLSSATPSVGRRLSLQSRSQFFAGWSLRGAAGGGLPTGKELVRSQTTIFGSATTTANMLRPGSSTTTAGSTVDAMGLFSLAPRGSSCNASTAGGHLQAHGPNGESATAASVAFRPPGVVQRSLQEIMIQAQVQLHITARSLTFYQILNVCVYTKHSGLKSGLCLT